MTDSRYFIGLYSGSACDGIDAALVTITGSGDKMRIREIASLTECFPDSIRNRLLAFSGGHTPDASLRKDKPEPAHSLAQLDRDVAIFASRVATALMTKAEFLPEHLAGTGFSGHVAALAQPGNGYDFGSAIILGNPAMIALRTGAPVVADFHKSDLAAGGLSMPITPWADWLIYRDDKLSRVAVHLGGISSITQIPAQSMPEDVVACQAGPGMILIDQLMHKFYFKQFDADGKNAAAGQVKNILLNELLAHRYFQQPMPKVTTPGEWSGHYIWRLLKIAEKHRCSNEDLLATVTELSARLIAGATAELTERPHEIYLSGAGALNIQLANRIRKLLCPSSTYTCTKMGIQLRAKQAVCCAILAAARIDKVSAHCKNATGSATKSLLGAIFES